MYIFCIFTKRSSRVFLLPFLDLIKKHFGVNLNSVNDEHCTIPNVPSKQMCLALAFMHFMCHEG